MADMNADEELVMDQSAYEMYHQAQTNSPCLSFDIIKDDLGENRTTFPHTCYIACGTQADAASPNHLIVMKMSNLRRTYKEKNSEDESEDDSDEDSEDEEEKPELEAALIKHNGCVNRLRCTQINQINFAATWSELGRVYIWNINSAIEAVSDQYKMGEFVRADNHLPVFQFNGHQNEGFALDWSNMEPGQLVTGDCTKNIHVWKPHESTWLVDQRPYIGHQSSVEDIQWSPNEVSVFASCSTDKTIRIWDIRATPNKANMLTCENAHSTDVNVINWNPNEPFIVSGGDDCLIKIWDLRLFQENKPVAILKFHSKPITSVEWNKQDTTVFAASSEDNKLSIWDLAVERDDHELNNNLANSEDLNKIDDDIKKMDQDDPYKDLPPQLLFIHEGQKEMKELHWHSQIPGTIICTAHSGFNIFKTISV